MMKNLFLFIILSSFSAHAQDGFHSWKEYGLKGKVKTMKVNYTNYEQSQIYSYRQYYFAENGSLDSIFYQSAGDYEIQDITQIFHHTNGKSDSAVVVDKYRNILNSIHYKWHDDTHYLETNYNLADTTLMQSQITLTQNYRDLKSESKMYKNEQLIFWGKYENTLSPDNLILSNMTQNLLDGTTENTCAEYLSYDPFGNPTDIKVYQICGDEKYWIRYQKEYEYYETHPK